MICIIGAGAAGIFAACAIGSSNVTILEKTRKPLAKVKISGGGRCNVTHACFDPKQLVLNYPRGNKALLGPFTHFGPKDTVNWFESRGVTLKTEADGRMFPITDSSQTIIDCLLKEIQMLNATLRTECCVTSIEKNNDGFRIHIDNSQSIDCEKLLIATGSSRTVFSWLEKLGHTIIQPVPSLFTFNIEQFSLKELAGISVERACVKIVDTTFVQTGPLLITHWGFSGPAVLKLSAFGARHLNEKQYNALVEISWLTDLSQEEIMATIRQCKSSKKLVANDCPFNLAMSLWKSIVSRSSITCRWAELSKKQETLLLQHLIKDRFQINGQTSYKEEFVTAGGVSCDEVNFKTMESKRVLGLYFAGEVLDIDGITGGFNFQNAWTTGYLAGKALGRI